MAWNGVQNVINEACFNLLNLIVVYLVFNPLNLTDHEGRVFPDALLIPKGTTVKELAFRIHEELGRGFLFAINAMTKRKLNASYILNNKDIIAIVSTYGRR